MTKSLPALGLALILAASAMAADGPEPVAKVNSQPITQAALTQCLLDWYGKFVLEEMIQALVIQQAADKAGIQITEQQVDQELLSMQKSMDEAAAAGQGEPFQVWLATRHMTIPNLRTRLRTQLQLRALVEGQVVVSPEEIAEFYEKNLEMFREPVRVKVSVISLTAQEEADTVLRLLKEGAKTWGDAARDYNVNPYTMKTGGSLGYRTDDGSPLMQAAMALQNDGDISEVVFDRSLYNIVKREDRQSARTLPFDDVKAEIESGIKENRRMELMMEARAANLKAAHIERFLQVSEGGVRVQNGQ